MRAVERPWTFLAGGILASSLIVLIAAPLNDGPVETLGSLLRATGRWAFLLFLPIFLASALNDYFGSVSTRMLLKYRGGIGLMLAGNQLVHLLLILLIFGIAPVAPQPPSVVIGGSIGMGLVALMAITSFRQVVRRVPSRMVQWAHNIGMSYLLFAVFFYDMVYSIFTKQPAWIYGLLSSLYYGALVFRVFVFVRKRRRLGFNDSQEATSKA